MRLVLLGAPGSGKGTQARLIEKRRGIRQLSTGDILRSAMEKETPLGQTVRQYMDAGRLVPDGVMLDLIRDVLRSEDYRGGFVLDGFPRTLIQARDLDRLLEEMDLALDAVIILDVSDEAVINRLGKRRICEDCSESFNLDTCPPEVPETCDRCGGRLIQREDDQPDTVRRRLEVYHRETEPLRAYYDERHQLRSVDGNRGVEAIRRDVSEILDSRAS
jgi:adenylate kinase